MPDNLQRARAFLLETHQLGPAETEEALCVAASVLRMGLTRLDAAIRAGDGEQCAEQAHALKGNLLNLGLPDLAALAAKAMEPARTEDFEAVRETGTSLTTALGPFWK
ncbi:Hpt domain protein [Solidesulfovibrio fructosivorans JJ]]|uniref:Hpt domain protein n=1 Tax=Solidesulfovibrio fructosivorans JJ] TaxID=596151 RepID=E1K051_SOLFR|nr:Hpt domain-containing protein [Solidesulfovibrio fructosivorans]EFL50057.1 Hpt domain protein [Solidesulfovibrio fructosivorans JJ]]